METTLVENTYEEKKQYAGFWIRTGAYLIDYIIVGIPLAIITLLVFILFFGTSDAFLLLLNDPYYMDSGAMTDEEALALMGTYFGALGVTFIINLIVAILYFVGLQSSKWQATVGKKILGLKVTTLNGERISFWRSLGRYAAYAFLSSILMIGFIITAFTERKQSLHDLIAGTVVIKK